MAALLRISATRLIGAVALCLAFLVAPLARAQATQPEIEARLLNKHLFLRGFWQENNLKFDSTGVLLSRCKQCTGSWTLSGIDIEKVQFKGNSLLLSGNRAWFEFNGAALTRISAHQGVRIEVAAAADYAPALAAIFADDLEDIGPSLPPLWLTYVYKNVLRKPPPPQPNDIPPGLLLQHGGFTQPPKLVHSADPAFSEAARDAHVTGNVSVGIVVGTDGKPHSIRILRPLGLGLDENAADAVSQYRLIPANKDGVPANTELVVEVSFYITP